MLSWIRRWSRRYIRFSGSPTSWAQAQMISSGYAEGSILERVANSTRLVISGKGVYERDGVVFDSVDFSYPLVAMLLHAAATNKGCLNVIDFGGSLGSTYRQCRPLLHGIPEIRWRIVEQLNFVNLGKTEFETTELSFYETLDQAVNGCDAKQVLLFSSVLQYLESPFATLQELDQVNISHLIIDRTPISNEIESRLCIQTAPPQIYRASYPCWVLSNPQLMKFLLKDWDLFADFASPEGAWQTTDGIQFEFRGFCFLKKLLANSIENTEQVT